MSTEDRYLEEEIWSAWNDVVNILWAEGKVVLLQPYASMRLGKLQQLRMARKYFAITPSSFLINCPDALRTGVESVVKSFNFKYELGIGFYSQKVREDQLDPQCAWFLTDFVDAHGTSRWSWCATGSSRFRWTAGVFLDQTIDWRLAPAEYAHRQWAPIELPPAVAEGIFAFMRDAGSHYARLDFLLAGDRYVFLEANFTGRMGLARSGRALRPAGQDSLRDRPADSLRELPAPPVGGGVRPSGNAGSPSPRPPAASAGIGGRNRGFLALQFPPDAAGGRGESRPTSNRAFTSAAGEGLSRRTPQSYT